MDLTDYICQFLDEKGYECSSFSVGGKREQIQMRKLPCVKIEVNSTSIRIFQYTNFKHDPSFKAIKYIGCLYPTDPEFFNKIITTLEFYNGETLNNQDGD